MAKKIILTNSEVLRLSRLGCTKKLIAEACGISESTLHRRFSESSKAASDVSDSLEASYRRGKSEATQEVLGILLNRCRAQDMAAVKFFLTHVSNFSKTDKVEVSGTTQTGLNIYLQPQLSQDNLKTIENVTVEDGEETVSTTKGLNIHLT